MTHSTLVSFSKIGLSLFKCKNTSLARLIHLSSPRLVGQEWRKKKGLPANPNAYGPLADGPDYCFVDGRPTPPGGGKVRRAQEQREIAEDIIRLTEEINFAVEHHKKKVADENSRKSNIIGRKLKEKGKIDYRINVENT